MDNDALNRIRPERGPLPLGGMITCGWSFWNEFGVISAYLRLSLVILVA